MGKWARTRANLNSLTNDGGFMDCVCVCVSKWIVWATIQFSRATQCRAIRRRMSGVLKLILMFNYIFRGSHSHSLPEWKLTMTTIWLLGKWQLEERDEDAPHWREGWIIRKEIITNDIVMMLWVMRFLSPRLLRLSPSFLFTGMDLNLNGWRENRERKMNMKRISHKVSEWNHFLIYNLHNEQHTNKSSTALVRRE